MLQMLPYMHVPEVHSDALTVHLNEKGVTTGVLKV